MMILLCYIRYQSDSNGFYEDEFLKCVKCQRLHQRFPNHIFTRIELLKLVLVYFFHVKKTIQKTMINYLFINSVFINSY